MGCVRVEKKKEGIKYTHNMYIYICFLQCNNSSLLLGTKVMQNDSDFPVAHTLKTQKQETRKLAWLTKDLRIPLILSQGMSIRKYLQIEVKLEQGPAEAEAERPIKKLNHFNSNIVSHTIYTIIIYYRINTWF